MLIGRVFKFLKALGVESEQNNLQALISSKTIFKLKIFNCRFNTYF